MAAKKHQKKATPAHARVLLHYFEKKRKKADCPT